MLSKVAKCGSMLKAVMWIRIGFNTDLNPDAAVLANANPHPDSEN
jgi:hypothetical protein